MRKSFFSESIILWYEENKRSLPWRLTRHPYKIWLSEIILQQTRIAQGLPYYLRFIENFPDIESLASAPEDRVLRLWQGLGYYSRARNLHACAKQVVKDYKGVFPNTYNELQKLPGIGSYTAAAIASISFREKVAVVDGNVFRVLARVFGIDQDIGSPLGKKIFFTKANELVPEDRPDLFNQAVMEFGALHCTPQNPKCHTCIFSNVCIANQRSLQKLLPVKARKQKVRKRYFNYVVIECRGKLLMRKRPTGDIWNGLYDFFLEETNKPLRSEFLLKTGKRIFKKHQPHAAGAPVKHVLSHQHLITRFWRLAVPSTKELPAWVNGQNLKFYTKKEVANLPKPILIIRFLEKQGLL